MTSRETYNALFVDADTAARAEDWPTLWALRDGLRETELWVGSYGPLCAIAGWHVDREAGRALLDEVVAAGFHQPELFGKELAATYASEPEWAEWVQRMRDNVPAPPVELLAWPDYEPTLEPVLDRLAPEREELLRERLPSPGGGAWESAVGILDWVTTRWEHANGHVDNRDAVEVLDRAAAGERFACVEYSVVLSQALNAARIPARTVSLLMRDHHTGAGRGHVVSEAWIDDLGRWVLLDGQNGAWWGADGEPLGVLALTEAHAAGNRPRMNSRHHRLDESDQEAWFWYFAAARTTGLAWSAGAFVPVFQTTEVLRSDRLVRGTADVAPDLARIATAVVDDDGPALSFGPVHPFATGVVVRRLDGGADPRPLAVEESFRLAGPAGEHEYGVATTTPYGILAESPLRFVLR